MSRETPKSVPDFLVASTPSGLRRLMRLNNQKRHAWHKYDIFQMADGKFIAWFHPDGLTAREKAEAQGFPLREDGES